MSIPTNPLDPTPQQLSPQLLKKLALGKALRKATPRSSHGSWQPALDRPDPIEVLELSNQGRLTNLLPIRYGRMAKSPFAFLRGSALLMAQDLATTPTTGLGVQGVGDCHLLNFGAFATPERNLIFDLNDFDETLPAPWEWDVKRLGASVLVAGQEIQCSEQECRSAVMATVRSYRQRLAEFATMTALQVWYSQLTVARIMELSSTENKKPLLKNKPVNHHAASALLPKITQMVDGQPRIIDNPPLVYHLEEHDPTLVEMQAALSQYRSSLRDDVRVLFDRYQLVDMAIKVVGVGSVGTRCAIALFMAGDQDPLFLQIKEARRSVFEPYARKSIYEYQGRRVVTGQRLLQAASDIFLGWMQSEAGHHFYVRQLRDMKSSVDLDTLTPASFQEYGEFCGWALARAHARSGDAAQIAGYLGQSETFETAIADFATVYAQQNNQDYQALVQAIKSGKVVAREADSMI